MPTRFPSWQGRLLLTLFRLIKLPRLALYATRFPIYTRGDFRAPRKLGFQPETCALLLAQSSVLYQGDYRLSARWRFRDRSSEATMAARLSHQLQYAVLVVPYNLAPAHPFPAALNAITEVIQALQ